MIRSILTMLLIFTATFAVADEAPRTISVSGTGSAEIEPDRARLQMSIVARTKKLSAAQDAVAKVTASVLALTDRMKIDRDRVDTTGASVRPDYRWNRQSEQQELRGYIAERQIVVEIRDLEKLGDLVEGAVSAGVNQVSPPQLDGGRRREAYREALARAAEDARANAAQLAASLGAKLGPVLQINAGASSPRPPMPNVRALSAVAAGNAPASYNAADLRYDATINVVFALEAN